jgi:sugar phosphate isomerase/epimerase
MIRLGGPVFINTAVAAGAAEDHGAAANDPEILVRAHQQKGYTAAYAPQISIEDEDLVYNIREAFEAANIMIAEVGHWTNPLHVDSAECSQWRQTMIDKLRLADALQANCSVCNFGSMVAGSVKSHSYHNFTEEAFERAVQNACDIIDTVRPTNTFFSYEIYPFCALDSPQQVRKFIDAVDRDRFAVHMDLVNLVNCPRNYFRSGEIMRECVKLFGDKIVSAHAKDLVLEEPSVSVLLHEIEPGKGNIDYHTYLRCLDSLPHDIPLMMEHMHSEAEYDRAAAYIRRVADEEGITL